MRCGRHRRCPRAAVDGVRTGLERLKAAHLKTAPGTVSLSEAQSGQRCWPGMYMTENKPPRLRDALQTSWHRLEDTVGHPVPLVVLGRRQKAFVTAKRAKSAPFQKPLGNTRLVEEVLASEHGDGVSPLEGVEANGARLPEEFRDAG